MASLFEALELIDDRSRPGAAMNMAVDEALLEQATNPLLRLYGWRRPALSFGYFGRFDEAFALGRDHEIVRRCTGGGIVEHGDDITYALVIPRTDRSWARPPLELYREIHAALRRAFARHRVAPILAETSSSVVSEACFARPVEADLLLDGRKIAGAAQRRSRDGLLQQGSIQGARLPDGLGRSFAAELAREVTEMAIPPLVTERSFELATRKYATEQWLRRR